jgi:hypothetical protein
MKPNRFSAALYLLLVFISGAVVGGFAYRLYNNSVRADSTPRTPEEWRRRYMDEMRARLHLTGDQAARVEQILNETRERYRALHNRLKPQYEAIQDEQVQKIGAILNENQRAEYEKLRKEREQRRKSHKRPF